MKDKLITEVGEKKLIQKLLDKRDKKLQTSDKKVKESYHDDAALLINPSKYTVVSTDMLLEHSHFPEEMTPYQMGKKIVTVNVSDILAMNAKPLSILISMGLPANMTLEEYDKLTDGILDKCDELNITLIGGDINQSNEIILSGTSIGQVDDEVKLQRNIKEGDLIAVTGELGSPAAALDLLNNDNTSIENKKDIIDSLLEAELPVKTSETLRKHHEIITSITDITDGLAVELGHLKEKNKDIGFEIDYNKLPYDKNIEKIAEINNKNLLDYLLHFGEEFELLITFDKDEYKKYEKELKNIHIIGKCNNTGKITLVNEDNEEIIPFKGYEHLKDD